MALIFIIALWYTFAGIFSQESIPKAFNLRFLNII
jgi:hypothetical protein